MSTYRECVYMVHDEMKRVSDDAFYTDEHIIWLLDKFRSYVLKREYSTNKKTIPQSNYQEICIDMETIEGVPGLGCETGVFVRSINPLPGLYPFSIASVYPLNYFLGTFSMCSMEQMRYSGFNKYMKNIIYCSIGPDNHLYLKAGNVQFSYIEKVKMKGVFEDASMAATLICDQENAPCDILDARYPLEEDLIIYVVELIVKELTSGQNTPSDDINNAHDDGPEASTSTGNNAQRRKLSSSPVADVKDYQQNREPNQAPQTQNNYQ